MKSIISTVVVVLFAVHISIAQGNQLNPVAAELFRNAKSKLTIAEKNKIAKDLGFVLSGNKDQPFALDKDSKEYPFGVLVYPTDLNKDGNEEIFVGFGNSYTSGHTGSSVALFIKNATGGYVNQLGFPGMLPDVLATASKGYPDLLIGGPGDEYPVWRWDGKAYGVHRRVKDADYGKLKKTSVEELSKSYQQPAN